ncbi:MAG: GGDEF domain-containing protein [Acidobacteriota bacterium]|nr:GGDEF domain-containing protein [Acidobacteriota bacterium]
MGGDDRGHGNPARTLMTDPDVLRYEPTGQLMGSVLVIAGVPADVGTHVVIEDQVVVGRMTTGLQLRDGQTSRQHCSVLFDKDADRYVVRDLGSTNGTQLNGERLEGERSIEVGDKILLGQTLLKFTLVDETEALYLRRMERLAGTDPLTGLHAKHRFDSMLVEALRMCRADRKPLTTLMMDMDGLKAINDRHGHRMGAHTIAEVGLLLGRTLAGRGEACRFGGDEFCAYLPRTAVEDATQIAEEFRRAVQSANFEFEGVVVQATISIGVAESSDTVSNLDKLVAAADKALYRAKEKGRNCVSQYRPISSSLHR